MGDHVDQLFIGYLIGDMVYSAEDDGQISISEESSRLNVQETHKVLYLNVSFPISVQLAVIKAFFFDLKSLVLLEDLLIPVILRLQIAMDQRSDITLVICDGKERIILRLEQLELYFQLVYRIIEATLMDLAV